jgi:hypothetical protein
MDSLVSSILIEAVVPLLPSPDGSDYLSREYYILVRFATLPAIPIPHPLLAPLCNASLLKPLLHSY